MRRSATHRSVVPSVRVRGTHRKNAQDPNRGNLMVHGHGKAPSIRDHTSLTLSLAASRHPMPLRLALNVDVIACLRLDFRASSSMHHASSLITYSLTLPCI
jgi:hypothetical protein